MAALVDGESYFEVFDTHQSTMDIFIALYDTETDELTDQVKRAALMREIKEEAEYVREIRAIADASRI